MNRHTGAEASTCCVHSETKDQIANRPSSGQLAEDMIRAADTSARSARATAQLPLHEFDEFGAEPARIVHKRGLQKKVNRQSCAKATGIVDSEGLGESILVVAGEVDPRVRRIIPQPATFDLNTGEAYPTKRALFEALEGKRYRPWIYTPDFLFELTSGERVFVEGKHTWWIGTSQTFGSVLGAMFELGHRVVVVTERQFSRALHHNLRVLRGLPGECLEPSKLDMMNAAAAESFSAGAARRSFGLTRSEVCMAVKNGALATDLTFAALSDRTRLVRAYGDLAHLQVMPL